MKLPKIYAIFLLFIDLHTGRGWQRQQFLNRLIV